MRKGYFGICFRVFIYTWLLITAGYFFFYDWVSTDFGEALIDHLPKNAEGIKIWLSIMEGGFSSRAPYLYAFVAESFDRSFAMMVITIASTLFGIGTFYLFRVAKAVVIQSGFGGSELRGLTIAMGPFPKPPPTPSYGGLSEESIKTFEPELAAWLESLSEHRKRFAMAILSMLDHSDCPATVEQWGHGGLSLNDHIHNVVNGALRRKAEFLNSLGIEYEVSESEASGLYGMLGLVAMCHDIGKMEAFKKVDGRWVKVRAGHNWLNGFILNRMDEFWMMDADDRTHLRQACQYIDTPFHLREDTDDIVFKLITFIKEVDRSVSAAESAGELLGRTNAKAKEQVKANKPKLPSINLRRKEKQASQPDQSQSASGQDKYDSLGLLMSVPDEEKTRTKLDKFSDSDLVRVFRNMVVPGKTIHHIKPKSNWGYKVGGYIYIKQDRFLEDFAAELGDVAHAKILDGSKASILSKRLIAALQQAGVCPEIVVADDDEGPKIYKPARLWFNVAFKRVTVTDGKRKVSDDGVTWKYVTVMKAKFFPGLEKCKDALVEPRVLSPNLSGAKLDALEQTLFEEGVYFGVTKEKAKRLAPAPTPAPTEAPKPAEEPVAEEIPYELGEDDTEESSVTQSEAPVTDKGESQAEVTPEPRQAQAPAPVTADSGESGSIDPEQGQSGVVDTGDDDIFGDDDSDPFGSTVDTTEAAKANVESEPTPASTETPTQTPTEAPIQTPSEAPNQAAQQTSTKPEPTKNARRIAGRKVVDGIDLTGKVFDDLTEEEKTEVGKWLELVGAELVVMNIEGAITPRIGEPNKFQSKLSVVANRIQRSPLNLPDGVYKSGDGESSMKIFTDDKGNKSFIYRIGPPKPKS